MSPINPFALKKFVSYRRVSTDQQGKSGLGLEAQQSAVAGHVTREGGELISDYVEVESGKRSDRPELAKALAHAKRSRAVLVVGKLDRLSRNAAFLCTLLDSGVEVVCCDNPTVNRLTLQILAVLAEDEARRISQRTRDALMALKMRGVLLGSARPGHWDCREHLRIAGLANAQAEAAKSARSNKVAAYRDLAGMVRQMRDGGSTLQQIADKLNGDGQTTRRGKAWNATQVLRVLAMENAT